MTTYSQLHQEVTRGMETYLAKAMLLGMEYDPRDHTLCEEEGIEGYNLFDADTLEPVPYSQVEYRRILVHDKKLGPEWLSRISLPDMVRIWLSQR